MNQFITLAVKKNKNLRIVLIKKQKKINFIPVGSVIICKTTAAEKRKKKKKTFVENDFWKTKTKKKIITFSDQRWTGHTAKYGPRIGHYRILFGQWCGRERGKPKIRIRT